MQIANFAYISSGRNSNPRPLVLFLNNRPWLHKFEQFKSHSLLYPISSFIGFQLWTCLTEQFYIRCFSDWSNWYFDVFSDWSNWFFSFQVGEGSSHLPEPPTPDCEADEVVRTPQSARTRRNLFRNHRTVSRVRQVQHGRHSRPDPLLPTLPVG